MLLQCSHTITPSPSLIPYAPVILVLHKPKCLHGFVSSRRFSARLLCVVSKTTAMVSSALLLCVVSKTTAMVSSAVRYAFQERRGRSDGVSTKRSLSECVRVCLCECVSVCKWREITRNLARGFMR